MDNYKAARAAGLFRVFGDADRVRIVSAILEQEMNISPLAEMVGMTESAVSHHLRVLRQMRLVKARREGREVYYSIDDPHIIAMFEQGIRYGEEERIPAERFMG
jgi:ArsR family transcriptional regulator